MTGEGLPERARTFRRELLEWSVENERPYPWRDPERTLYEVFVAEFLLIQTPADNVAELYPDFLSRFPTLESIRGVPEAELAAVLEPVGFHNMRAEALAEIAAAYDELPADADELRELPRVGEYVANATLCFAREHPLPIVDRNVERVYERYFGDAYLEYDGSPLAFAEAMLPADSSAVRRYNLALLDLGGVVCRKRDPDCPDCPVGEHCRYFSD
jgi:A/G-specific adenine glycosylase